MEFILPCLVVQCLTVQITVKESQNINIFGFRKTKKETCAKWIHLCGREKKTDFNPATQRVCSRHFPPSAFQRNLKYELLRLPVPSNQIAFKPGAVPTLHLSLPPATKSAECPDVLKTQESAACSNVLKTHEDAACSDVLRTPASATFPDLDKTEALPECQPLTSLSLSSSFAADIMQFVTKGRNVGQERCWGWILPRTCNWIDFFCPPA
ncbi:uncharacterized protein LOC123520643 [Portunus trituberculatus]|uniref:uncharacterized protein LOC123520643 n=1 Tax=Portunus trituberculatus TaxID=210409 RepID=UPI001E1D1547|nr:uncharacterized protein LOC123520643 [Portunus trituberculatus]